MRAPELSQEEAEREQIVQGILKLLRFEYLGEESSPLGVLYFYDKHDLSADHWRRIEEYIVPLARRVQTQRQQAEEMEARRARLRRPRRERAEHVEQDR